MSENRPIRNICDIKDTKKLIKYDINITLSRLGKNFSGRHYDFFPLLFLENRLWNLMQIVLGDNLNEKSKPTLCQGLFSGKIEKNITGTKY